MLRKEKLIKAAIIALGIVALSAALFAAYQTSQLRLANEKVAKLRANVQELVREGPRILWEAKQVRLSIQKEKEEAAEWVSKAEEAKKALEVVPKFQIAEVYGQVKRLLPGRNQVHDSYLDWFELRGNSCTSRMANETNRSVRPSISIYFLNKYGFVTDTHHVSWILDELDPGEASVDTEQINFRAGTPEYYITRVVK